MLMPPSLVEWLPGDHLVWTVLGAVDQMDLDRFTEVYRLGGAGRPAYDPAMLEAAVSAVRLTSAGVGVCRTARAFIPSRGPSVRFLQRKRRVG